MKYFVGIILLALGLYYAFPLLTGPSKIIEDISAFTEDNSIVVQVNFSVPVRYENHFPQRSGEFLQIKMRLISMGKTDWKESMSPTALRPELMRRTSLVSVSYEGDVEGGPLLTFLFSQPVIFEVRQDTSLHSLVVVFPQAVDSKGVSL